YLGLLPTVVGAVIYAWCAWEFARHGRGTPAPIDPPRELVVRGLYRYTRNPMYVGVVTMLLGEAVLFGSLALLEYAAAVFALFAGGGLLYEEPTLRAKFGDSYRRYCQTVPRWLPSKPRAAGDGDAVRTDHAT